MTIKIEAGRNEMAASYGANFPYGALFQSDPTSAGLVSSEVSGGTPPYARKAFGWGAPAASQIAGGATFDAPSAANPQYLGAMKSATAGTPDMRDYTAVTPVTFSSQGTYQVSATYTQA